MMEYSEIQRKVYDTLLRNAIQYIGNRTPEQLGRFKQKSELEMMLTQLASTPGAFRTMKHDRIISELSEAVNVAKQYSHGGE